MESLSAILKEIEAVPTYMPNCRLLRDSINRATEWLKEVEAMQVKHILNKMKNEHVGNVSCDGGF